MSKKKGKEEQTLDEKLKMAIVPKEEEPYKVSDNWVWTKVKNVNEVVTGGTPSKKVEEYWENRDINFVKPSDLYQGRNLNFSEEYIDIRAKEKVRMIPKESTILCCIGSIGKSGYSEIDCCTNQQINSLIPKKEILNPLYNYYYSNSQYFINQMQNSSSATTIAILNKSKTEELYFPLPPIDEQERIVNKLDYFFDKIQKVKEIIEEVKEKNEARKESILSKAFTGELTAKWRADNIHSAKELLSKISDEKLSNWEQECQKAEAEGRKKPTKPKLKSIDEMIVPNDEIPYKIPNNWVWTRLEDIASYIQRGKSPKYVDESSIYVISQKCVQWTGFELDKARYTSDEVKYTEERFLKKGDILWNSTGTGTVGRVCTLEEIDENQKMVADSHVTVVRTSDNVISKCILNYLISNNVQNNLDSLTTGSTNQKELTLSSVKNLAIPLPPIEEQKEIVRILDNIFTKENLINELISLEDKIQALEKSILSKAFRGELGTNSKDDIEAMELLKEILQK